MNNLTDVSSRSEANLLEVKNRSVEILNHFLETGDEALRCYSARACGEIKTENTTQALNQCLYHPDPDVVIDAAAALAEMQSGDIHAIADVARHHPEGDARLAALKALGRHTSFHQVESIIISFAIGRNESDDWGVSTGWDDWWDLQLIAVKILSEQHKPQYLDIFLDILEQDPEPELEFALYKGIARINAQWVVSQLPTAKRMKKRKLLKALGENDQQLSKAFLFKHLKDEDSLCRCIAIEAISKLGANEYFWDVLECIKDENVDVQKSALFAIEQFSASNRVDTKRLIQYINGCNEYARIELFKLICHADLSGSDVRDLIALLSANTPELAISFIENINTESLNTEHITELEPLISEILTFNTLDIHHHIRLIRALDRLPSSIESLLPLLERRINEVDQKQNHTFEACIRQACMDVVSQSNLPACQHIIKTTLFGLNAYPDKIEVTQPVELEESELNVHSALKDHDVPEQLPTENAPISTLNAIFQANLEQKLVPAQSEDEQQVSIVEMVDNLDDQYAEFASVVKSNFSTADNLQLNRKKIARLPEFENKTLALRALGQSRQSEAVGWIIESILGASDENMHEIFQALTLQMQQNPKQKECENGIGAAANVLMSGHEIIQQSALKYLANTTTSKAVTLIIEALGNPSEHVRIAALYALENHGKALGLLFKPLVKSAAKVALNDPASGVRKQALKLVCLLWEYGDEISPMLDLALKDDECHPVAVIHFLSFKYEALYQLNQQIGSLPNSQKPNAIKLIGALAKA
ncbi:HEAT repeat domain-containing protein [Vibrio penaeicida]|uniref:HEAT repeat domain-containing protein n=1 Tax=Vibrio penaeicida TaxID=104609 RepID=UPI000CEA09E6|nr:HEAT repeat domain-containing protein [Vibrio penaeicida]